MPVAIVDSTPARVSRAYGCVRLYDSVLGLCLHHTRMVDQVEGLRYESFHRVRLRDSRKELAAITVEEDDPYRLWTTTLHADHVVPGIFGLSIWFLLGPLPGCLKLPWTSSRLTAALCATASMAHKGEEDILPW